MSRMLFVNLPIADLKRSTDFFTELGFTFNPQFTDENATCMIVNDEACVMLLVRPYFETFTDKALVDAQSHVQTLLTISADSREQVDEIADKALAAGGKQTKDPQDQGFMYGRSFQDPDGHDWEVMFMDMSQVNW